MSKRNQMLEAPAPASEINYVRWIHPERRAVMGYGILEPGSVHRVADLPGDPLLSLGVTFEAATAEEYAALQPEEPVKESVDE